MAYFKALERSGLVPKKKMQQPKAAMRGDRGHELEPFINELRNMKINVPGLPAYVGFTIKQVKALFDANTIILSVKTVERRLNELADHGILEMYRAGKRNAYRFKAK